MVSDMILLSQTNVLIAAKHSTFTQSLPLSILFDRKQQQFCEVSATGRAMTCTSNMKNWLFRTDTDDIHTYYSNGDTDENDEGDVSHMLTLLLPDIEPSRQFTKVKLFLEIPWTDPSEEAIFYYGLSKINKKYRTIKSSNESIWNTAVAND
jgi:hypothetical protein